MTEITSNASGSTGIDLSGSHGPGTGTPAVTQQAPQYEGTWGSGNYTGDSLSNVAGIPHSGLISNYLNDLNQVNTHANAGDLEATDQYNHLENDIDAFYANGQDGNGQYLQAQQAAQRIGLASTPAPTSTPTSEPLNLDGDSSSMLGASGGASTLSRATSSTGDPTPDQASGPSGSNTPNQQLAAFIFPDGKP